MTIDVPFELNQTVYKICPRCNINHNGSCKHCAWAGCFMTGCDVGVRVFPDGSYNELPLQIVPKIVGENNFVTTLKYWNIMHFPDEKSAQTAIDEYSEIRKIPDRQERYKKYLEWERSRALDSPFIF